MDIGEFFGLDRHAVLGWARHLGILNI